MVGLSYFEVLFIPRSTEREEIRYPASSLKKNYQR